MSQQSFHYALPIDVRFRDLDARNHVNNAVCFTYMEEARIRYMQQLGLLAEDKSDTGMIVAEATCTYKAPISMGQSLLVRVRVSEIKNSSFIMLYSIEDAVSTRVMATGRTVQVCYDYANACSTPIPSEWRARIEAFEQRSGYATAHKASLESDSNL